MDKIKRSAFKFILLLSNGEQKNAVMELQQVEQFTVTDMNDFRSLLSEIPFENSYSDFKLVLLSRRNGRPPLSAAKQKADILKFLQGENFTTSETLKIASLLSEEPIEDIFGEFKLVLRKRTIARPKSALLRRDAYEIGRKVFLRIKCLQRRKRSNAFEWAIKVICRVEKRPPQKNDQSQSATQRKWGRDKIIGCHSYYLKVEKARKGNPERLLKLPPLPNEEQGSKSAQSKK